MQARSWFALAVLAVAASAPAGAAQDVSAAARACRTEADDARRLACYDRAVDGAKPAAAAPQVQAPAPPAPAAAAPAAATAAAAAPAASPEDNFGRERQMQYEEEQRRAEETRSIGELRASIAGIETRMDGLMTFTLDNGQVWRQVRPDSRFSINTGDAVRIQAASLGSFILSGPTKKSTRVSRVK